MALANKGFRTPPSMPPIKPRRKGPSIPSIPKKSLRFDIGADDLRKEVKKGFFSELDHLKMTVGNVLKNPNTKLPQKLVKEETKKKPGVFHTLLGPTPKKEKKAIPSKIKSSLFGKGEKAIKYKEFEKFLKNPSLYRIDKLSSYQRKKKWAEIFKKTGTGYLKRWKVKKYFKDRALKSPKTIKEVREKRITGIYEKKFLEK